MADIDEFFNHNEVVIDMIRQAAMCTSEEQPFVATFLSQEDRWHVMNICMNRISSIFGAFHVFFNEARRCKSYFRSAWYLFAISSAQNKHRGRFFVTPYKPVISRVDVGVRRLRIELVNEQEMRDICCGVIKAPEWGFFNNRHKQRWNILQKMSELFENQLVIVNEEPNPIDPSSPGVVSRVTSLTENDTRFFFPPPKSADSSPRDSTPDDQAAATKDTSDNSDEEDETSPALFGEPCGGGTHHPTSSTNPRELALRAIRSARRHKSMCKETDNCILRVHIPFPSSVVENMQETHAKDVVLFE